MMFSLDQILYEYTTEFGTERNLFWIL